MSAERTYLQAFVHAWLEEIAPLSYADLAARQEPPFASVPFGAAGVAYALLRAGRALGDEAIVARGQAWAGDALRFARTKQGLRLPGGADAEVAPSLAYGAGGVRHVALLLARARGDAAEMSRLVGGLVRSSRRAGGRSDEFLFGRAGHLASSLLLFEATGDRRLRALAAEQAGPLLGRPRARARPAWTRDANLSFAHGRAGVAHALLGWHRAEGLEPPAWLIDELVRLARESVAWGRERQRAPRAAVLTRSWCNGAAGLTLLWARAYEQTGDARFRRLAQAGARRGVTAAAEAGGDLCCGLAGRAYAALAAERVAPGAGHREDAVALAVRAVDQMQGRWPNGLLKGYPGVVCLAVDLAFERAPRGFPFVEA
ncbi:MAG TPA: lanthionine synthetase LanC family protein [Polyangiaceae bacterium]|nr:lanthionine synthetase LanC family protein [Polyangiaceae bacterium]